MSTVYLHVGQAGNEVGAALWSLAAREKPPQQWLFDERGRARCVLVDTEPKVVRGVVRALGAERIHPRCALVEQSGRGNNWAMGYHGTDSDKGKASHSHNGIAEAALEALRWQWERCDWCGGLVMTASVGGGTGSGLGSLLLEAVRDEYPRHYLTAVALCPFAAGELPLGHYNATLALSYLQEHADATVIVRVDRWLATPRTARAQSPSPSYASHHRHHMQLVPSNIACDRCTWLGQVLFDNTSLLRQLTAAAATSSHAASHSSRPPARLCMRQIDAYVARCIAGLAFPTDGAKCARNGTAPSPVLPTGPNATQCDVSLTAPPRSFAVVVGPSTRATWSRPRARCPLLSASACTRPPHRRSQQRVPPMLAQAPPQWPPCLVPRPSPPRLRLHRVALAVVVVP